MIGINNRRRCFPGVADRPRILLSFFAKSKLFLLSQDGRERARDSLARCILFRPDGRCKQVGPGSFCAHQQRRFKQFVRQISKSDRTAPALESNRCRLHLRHFLLFRFLFIAVRPSVCRPTARTWPTDKTFWRRRRRQRQQLQITFFFFSF